MFLHNNPHHNTAAEIVRIRKSTKSHVSSSLKKLENKGLIKRKQSKDNKNIPSVLTHIDRTPCQKVIHNSL